MTRFDPFTPAEMSGHRLAVLVEVDCAGIAARVSGDTLHVSSASGDRFYDGTISSLQYARGLDLFGGDGTSSTVELAAFLSVDLPALYARGNRIEGRRVEVSQVRVSIATGEAVDSWERRRVVFRGQVVGLVYGVTGADGMTYAEISAERPLWYSERRIASEGVDGSTWDSTLLHDDDLGRAYPLLIGYPGIDPYDPDGCFPALTWRWGSRATSYHVAVIGTADIEATSVLTCPAGGSPVMREVEVTTTFTTGAGVVPCVDEAGTALAVVDYNQHSYESGGTQLPADYIPGVEDDATDIYMGCTAATGGGIVWRGRLLRDAGDVVLWLLERSGAVVDYGRAEAARAALAAYKIDGAITAECNPVDLLVDGILPLLPVSLVNGESGVYPVVWNPDVRASDTSLRLDSTIDPLVAFADHVETDASKIVNNIAIKYAPNARTGDYRYVMAVGHEAKATTHRAWTRIASTDTSGDVEWVTIYAAETGPAGADITITVASGGSTVVTDDLITRTVAIVFATSDNSADIAAVINASSALVRAKGQDTELWLGTTTPTATLKLGHFGTLRHPACAESHDMLRGGDGGIGAGIRRLELSTDWMCDAASVRAALWWRASAFALPHRRVTVTAPDTYAALDRPGSPVVVHHPELGLYDTVGLVETYEHDLHAGRVAVQVLIIDRPGRQWGQS